MTRSARPPHANYLESFAALALQRAQAMRAPLALALLCAAAPAVAQQQPGGMTGTSQRGTCTGALAGTVGLSLGNTSISDQTLRTVFGAAECLCANRDISLQIQLTSTMLQPGQGSAEMWVGIGCENYTNRTTATNNQCRRVDQVVDFDTFALGGSASTNYIQIPIPTEALWSTGASPGCQQQMLSNNIFLIFSTGGPDNLATCTLSLEQRTVGTDAPQNVRTIAGDGRVRVLWSNPTQVSSQLAKFQVLCADAEGRSLNRRGQTAAAYSVCTDEGIQRRSLPTASSSSGITPTADGGTRPDLGTLALPWDEPTLGTQQTVDDMAVADAGAVVPAGRFESLDHTFICAPEIGRGGPDYSVTIDGLENGQSYQFIVVAVDNFGNATASAVATGAPAPTEDLWDRYTRAGGGGSGFCFIATAAFGSYEDRYVRVLRDFRDDVLLATPEGRAFVDWYYTHSPAAAAYIAERPALRILTQLVLWPVIAFAAFVVYLSAWQKALLLSLVVAALCRKQILRALRRA